MFELNFTLVITGTSISAFGLTKMTFCGFSLALVWVGSITGSSDFGSGSGVGIVVCVSALFSVFVLVCVMSSILLFEIGSV